MSVLAVAASSDGTAIIVASVIAAVAALLAAGITAFVALRAQSYKQLLQDIEDIVDEGVGRTADAVRASVKRGVRDVLGHTGRGDSRRWYDR